MPKKRQPKPKAAPLDPDAQAVTLLQEIEADYPPSRCSLETYRDILIALRAELQQRIGELNEEIGDS
jgi:hypothetical protein